MHLTPNDHQSLGPKTVKVRLLLEDPHALTGHDDKVVEFLAAKGEILLWSAIEQGVNLEHACGGVCACSTCHVHITQGMNDLPDSTDDEMDRVDEAPGVNLKSRLACQCRIQGDGPIEVSVPAWNRNAVKEVPHAH